MSKVCFLVCAWVSLGIRSTGYFGVEYELLVNLDFHLSTDFNLTRLFYRREFHSFSLFPFGASFHLCLWKNADL